MVNNNNYARKDINECNKNLKDPKNKKENT